MPKPKKTRTPNPKKPDDPVQSCPLKKKQDPKYCYLTGIDIVKGDRPKRTRWGKSASKFTVFPLTVRDKEESNTSSSFPVFDPISVNDPSAPAIHIVAVRPNLVGKGNKAMTIQAELRAPKKSDKADVDHEADKHQTLEIDRSDDSNLRGAAHTAIDALVEALHYDDRIKKAWEDIEKRRGKLEAGLSKLESDPRGAQRSIEEALTFERDDEDEDDDDEDDGDAPGDNSQGDDEDSDGDGEDEESTPSKLKARVYPQDPTIAKIFAKAPVALAKWCPENFSWGSTLPNVTDVLRALWLKDFEPRVYNITASSCGDAPPDKAAEATRSLAAQIRVYPADQFKFILRVPKLAKSSVGYEGRYISEKGEFKTVKTSSTEIKGTGKKKEDEEPRDGEEDQPKEDEGFPEGPDLYDPESYEDDSGDDDEDDDDADDTLLELSEEKWILPWDDGGEKAPDDDGGKKAKKKSKEDEEGDVEGFALKLLREAQAPETDQDNDKQAKASKGNDDLELDYSESLNAIFNVIQSIREVWDNTKGLSFTLGFSMEASVGFLEGKADWEWGWRESTRLTSAPSKYLSGLSVTHPDRQMPYVVYSEKFTAKLTVLSLDLSLKLGIDLTYAGVGFRVALVGTISGKLNYEANSIKEYCPVREDYFKTEPENWATSSIEGTLEAKAILVSADTFRATSKIKTGYWIRAKRGDDESPQIAYEWRFLGLKIESEFKIKGYKTVSTDEVVLLDETPEDTPHAGTFPTYASKKPFAFRQTLMEYKGQCWDIQQDMQAKMTELRVLYFSKFFPKLWSKIQASANVEDNALIWGKYADYRMENWLSQLRRIALTAPDGQIALGIQHTFRRGFAARSGYSSWASRSGLWDDELDGMLVPENTDLDVMGKDMGELLWNLRVLGAFYKRFVVFTDVLVDYCDKAIAASREEEQRNSRAEPSWQFKEQFLAVGRAFRDVMYGPYKNGEKDPNNSGWKDGKFKRYFERVRDQIKGFDMEDLAANQLVDGYANARIKGGRIKFNYPLSTTHSGYWTNDELSNSNIKWQTN